MSLYLSCRSKTEILTIVLCIMFVVPLTAAKRGGTIERRELATYPAGAVYKVQPKAWFSEDIMLEWVEEVLAPYVATPPPGIMPLLYLDSFRVHMMGSVVSAIQAIGVEVEFIPPGCTGLVQPVDVGYNKSFKAKVKDQYMNWLMVQDPDAPIPTTTLRDVVGWVLAAAELLSLATPRHTWRSTGWSPRTPRGRSRRGCG